jgi:hypothetical protein
MNAEYGDITLTSPEAFRVKTSGFAVVISSPLVENQNSLFNPGAWLPNSLSPERQQGTKFFEMNRLLFIRYPLVI